MIKNGEDVWDRIPHEFVIERDREDSIREDSIADWLRRHVPENSGLLVEYSEYYANFIF